MMGDRDLNLLKEAVSELARLKGAAEGPTPFLPPVRLSPGGEGGPLGHGPASTEQAGSHGGAVRRHMVLARTGAASA